MRKEILIFLLSAVLAACSQQAPEELVSSAPEESAEAFIARVNGELKELSRDLGAAGWVREPISQKTPQY